MFLLLLPYSFRCNPILSESTYCSVLFLQQKINLNMVSSTLFLKKIELFLTPTFSLFIFPLRTNDIFLKGNKAAVELLNKIKFYHYLFLIFIQSLTWVCQYASEQKWNKELLKQACSRYKKIVAINNIYKLICSLKVIYKSTF